MAYFEGHHYWRWWLWQCLGSPVWRFLDIIILERHKHREEVDWSLIASETYSLKYDPTFLSASNSVGYVDFSASTKLNSFPRRKNVGPQFFLRHTEIRFLAQVFLATKFWHWENLSTPLQLATSCSWLLNAFGGSIWPAFWRLLPWDAVFGQLIDSLHHGHDCIMHKQFLPYGTASRLPSCCTMKNMWNTSTNNRRLFLLIFALFALSYLSGGGSQPIRRRGLKLQAKNCCHWKHPKIILVTKNSLRINWVRTVDGCDSACFGIHQIIEVIRCWFCLAICCGVSLC